MIENVIIENGNLSKVGNPNEELLENELYEPIWAVITFDSVVAHHLTYEEAIAWAEKLEKQMQNGVCIVTDSAAERMALRANISSQLNEDLRNE
ncbi:MAG: hypothetical protein D6687_02680 [Acidobacteria bacterium]|jgi:acyl-CoA reductase-like NAD-dependent aldehyde dehydrogenase|nr:MAG: hypothetical protein D6687_02680 [Acidobacteriota bacterium]GIU82983.1 MAG: hypothetical protein KatS3mg006_2047 [Pyrinomonadaceae bacterium]